MMFQIKNEGGYIVEAYIALHNESIPYWHPIRNFGDNQGDARLFMQVDCPKFSANDVIILANRYKRHLEAI